MFQYEKSITGKINLDRVWELYSNVDRWTEWDQDIQKVVLEGAFQRGTKGTMFLKDMPPLPFTLSQVEKGQGFQVISVLGEITVEFGHDILHTGNEEYALKHTVTISGPNEAQIQGIGRGITANIPTNMEQLLLLSQLPL